MNKMLIRITNNWTIDNSEEQLVGMFLDEVISLFQIPEEDGCFPYPPVRDGSAYPHGYLKDGEHVLITCHYNSSLLFTCQCRKGSYIDDQFPGCPAKNEPYMPDGEDSTGCEKYDGYYPNTHAEPPGPYKDGEEFWIGCNSDSTVSYRFVCKHGHYSGFLDDCPDFSNTTNEPENLSGYEDKNGCGLYPFVMNGYADPPGPVNNGEHVTVKCNFSHSEYNVTCQDGTYETVDLKCPEAQKLEDDDPTRCKPYPSVENGYAYPTGPLKHGEELFVICPKMIKIYKLVCVNGEYRGSFTNC
ncbi:hypothetical protein DICVIV_00922 [Dictyocaulus viviparus]|uniref:Uncharacterized protein n=1 Tax=Dictyocaulus viviparus TaxID=29172 RepID=A0A0D8YE33_DICVI|nr:hypothetical protein DICVIV_00922 [Dictyocaulus viviparus]